MIKAMIKYSCEFLSEGGPEVFLLFSILFRAVSSSEGDRRFSCDCLSVSGNHGIEVSKKVL